MMLHGLLLLSLQSLLVAAQLEAQEPKVERVITHFGNCVTADYGPGRCFYRNKCNFYDVNVLNEAGKRHCYSQQRLDLVCCPVEQNILPLFGPRVANSSEGVPARLGWSPTNVVAFSSADELPQHPYCGTSFAFKVVGGTSTALLEFPWTSLLEYTKLGDNEKEHVCGASFIAQRWLLTAAHCVHADFVGRGRTLTGVRLGEWNKTSNPDCITHWNGKQECAPSYIQASIDRQIVHPLFDRGNLTHDIALLRLAEPVDWHQLPHVEPVCLPPARGAAADQLVGSAVDVSGWGHTGHRSELSNIKQKAVLYVQPQERCEQIFSQHNYYLTEGQLCASGGMNTDTCLGDSGGPLTVEAYTPQRDRFVYLAGIVSYGKEHCGKTDFPGVYTRVSSYMDWIEQTIRNNSDGAGTTFTTPLANHRTDVI